jgi:hypothetical protein
MSLQELMGELQALSLAYPDTTQIMLRVSSHNEVLSSVAVSSNSEGITIVLKDEVNA